MATVIKPKRSFTPLQIPAASALEVGELAMNASDGKFYTKLSNGTVKELGGAGSVILQDVTTNGNITTNNIILNGSDLVFEGYLGDVISMQCLYPSRHLTFFTYTYSLKQILNVV